MNDFTGHTQGPWEVEYGQLHPASEKEAYTIRTDAFDVVSGHLAIRREEDARLIAAAPDLLAERDLLHAALKESLALIENMVSDLDMEFLTYYSEHRAVMEQARTALQEAEG